MRNGGVITGVVNDEKAKLKTNFKSSGPGLPAAVRRSGHRVFHVLEPATAMSVAY